ncbi:hypothetical protein EJB05_40245 [Eragrostis curvula]|uniref:F-box associated beta-propeller type 1 domain-containing protein n=1 Tax=Eragrostis curvula TaxID=38414 RepID=A0A5J9TZC0_9POAL|nr:hypothetical protein EJB05_40245 [Eragrostis curvula]
MGSERMAGKVEREEADAKKTRTDNDAPGKAIPGHVFEAILVRLPARSAVACMMLSKQHRQLICSQEFRKLHCRLGAPLPRPHIAYIMTAPVKRPNREEEVSSFHGFYLAGAGLNCNDAPVRSFTVPRKTKRQSEKKYINTCNGILLLASTEGSDEPGGCILWNPAVADSRMVVTVPSPPPSQRMEYLALGLGYGPRTGTYKILLLRRNGRYANDAGRNHLAIYHLEDPKKEPRVFEGEYGVIRQEALYMDGRIYVIDEHHLAILSVDVDSEIVTSIHLPVRWQTVLSRPMELSGRLCIALKGGHESSIWLLSCDNQWEQVCLLGTLLHLFRAFGKWARCF